MKNFDIPTSWRGIREIEEAKRLIDYGILLPWTEARKLRKDFTPAQQEALVRHFALRLGERIESRLPEEILIESVLCFLANCQVEEVLYCFLDELLNHPNSIEACLILTEVAISLDLSSNDKADDIFSMAVALVCELGVAVREIGIKFPAEEKNVKRILDHVSTYLLSVSNCNSPCIRLSLIHYFGVIEQGKVNKPGFNRVMVRFGHTVLEHLFVLLFNKRTESVALQFLLENLPFVLEADNHCQSILHQTFKFYMLKKPERFALFLHTFARHLRSLPETSSTSARQLFLKHLGVLLKVVSEVNHKTLAREIMVAVLGFDGNKFKDELVSRISNDHSIRPSFKLLLEKMVKGVEGGADPSATRSTVRSKRGRKPSFSKGENLRPIHQVSFLGQKYAARAS